MNEREYNHIIAGVFGRRKVSMRDIQNIKKIDNIQDMRLIMSIIYKNPKVSIFFKRKIMDYNDLLLCDVDHIFTGECREEVLIKEIEGELNYLTVQILLNYNVIQEFFRIRHDFECSFMRGNFKNALRIVNEFEQRYGYSFWSIDCNISALSFEDVNQANKFCDKVIDSCNDFSIKAYIDIERYRFLKDVTGSYFKAQFGSILQEYDEEERDSNFKEAFKDYLRINTDIGRGFDLVDIRSLLIISNYVPLIDKYIILEKIIGWLSSEAVYQESKLRNCIVKCSVLLNKKLDIPFWQNICNLLTGQIKIVIMEEKIIINKGLRLFCAGKVKESYDYCIQMLEQYSNCFPLINLLAKSGDCNIKGIPYLELAWLIRKIYMKEGKNTNFINIIELCNIYERIFSFFSFGDNLGVIIENETTPIMLQGKMSYVNALLCSNFIPSKLAFFLPESKREKFIEKYKFLAGELFFCDWQIATYSEAKKTFLLKYVCDETSYLLNEIKNEKYDEKLFDNNMKDENILNRNICKSFMLKRQFDIAVAENDLFKAIDIYVKAYFISEWMVIKIDCNKINEKITRKLKGYLENQLSYCIYAYITRFELSKGESISETVVNSCRKIIKKTSESIVDFRVPQEELEKKKTIYFLRNICTYDVLRRVKMGASLVQELYSERIQIIDKILPYYESAKEREDVNALKKEKKEILSKIEYLDIAKCINKGKINTSWIVFSEEAEGAMISVYNMYYNMIHCNTISSYVNAFAIVKKDYVQEINRILSITIRHGILEGELLRFLKRTKNTEYKYLSEKTKKNFEKFYKKIHDLIDLLLRDYLVCTYKYEKDTKLLLFVDEEILIKSFHGLPKSIDGPEDIRIIFKDILDCELEKRLPDWGKKVCTYIDKEIRKNLKELYDSSEDDVKTYVNKVSDLLGEEIEKVQNWFNVTENQNITYRLATLGEMLKKEWESVQVYTNIDNKLIVSGNIINFLYTIIRELIWNAEKYSGYKEDDSEFYITINMNIEDENIIFEVINNIERHIILEEVDKNIKILQQVIKSVEKSDEKIFNRKDISEGKSGYKKIVKLLKRNYDGKYQMEPKRSGNEFIIKIALALEELM